VACAIERVAKIWDAVYGFHHGYEHHETLNKKAVHKSDPAPTLSSPKYHLQMGCRPHKPQSRKEEMPGIKQRNRFAFLRAAGALQFQPALRA
jgi:hypothetical protein